MSSTRLIRQKNMIMNATTTGLTGRLTASNPRSGPEMTELTFELTSTATSQIHDILSCLSKFDENVILEASNQELRISGLNSTKSAYASFSLDSAAFFVRYHYSPSERGGRNVPRNWACKLQNRALLSIFRRRTGDREKDTAIEQCTFELQARPDVTECRLVFRLLCGSNVVKVYRLTYEPTDILSATFDRQNSPNRWSISSKTLRDAVEFFGPKTEHVDWSLIDGKVTFTSYTEKIQVGKEIVRQPTHTSITFSEKDFQECKIEPAQHLSIPVKDFRAIVAHADTLKVNIKASYSHGHRPIRIEYAWGGLTGEFTLMTKGTSITVAEASKRSTLARNLSMRPVSRDVTRAPSVPEHRESEREPSALRGNAHTQAERTQELSRRTPSPDPEPPQPTANNADPDSFFIPNDTDQDQQWDPPNFVDDDQGLVTWDNTGTGDLDRSFLTERRSGYDTGDMNSLDDIHARQRTHEIAPTQRLSQIRGLFD